MEVTTLQADIPTIVKSFANFGPLGILDLLFQSSKRETAGNSVLQSAVISYVHMYSIVPHYRILPKISPLPSLTSKFLHRYFYLVDKPHPYATNNAPSIKMNVCRSTRTLLFVVWTVCLLHLLALSAKYG